VFDKALDLLVSKAVVTETAEVAAV
jgi:hypothetical protein